MEKTETKIPPTLGEKVRFKVDAVKDIPSKEGMLREIWRRRAITTLSCCEKTVDKYIKAVEEDDLGTLVHGNTGRKPAIAKPDETRSAVVNLYQERYRGASYAHFVQLLSEDYGISISDSTARNWLLKEGLLSPRSHKSTIKAVKEAAAEAEEAVVETRALDNLANDAIILDRKDAHPLRPRCKYYGEMIQMDASQYKWNGRDVWHLHLAVDDATSHVVGAYFDNQETLNGYYHVLDMILRREGIPVRFYTDRRTVFEYDSLRKAERVAENDTMTQFAHACRMLGIELKTTSEPQQKGRIERANQTFQGRLPIDLMRKGIMGMDEANRFLSEEYIDYYNRTFAPLTEKDIKTTVFAPAPDEKTINQILAVITGRSILGGHCVRYKGKYFLPADGNGRKVYFRKHTKGYVIEAFDGGLYYNVNDVLYALEEVEERSSYSPEFDGDEEKPARPRKKYIPPIDHPWRQSVLAKSGFSKTE